MIAAIVSWFASGGVAAIGEQLNRAYAAKLSAKNSSERIAAEQTIATLQAQQSILLAEQGSWLTAWIRPAFALPFVIYDFKIVVYDKVLGLGTTDNLSPDFWKLQMLVFGAYFLMRPLERRR